MTRFSVHVVITIVFIAQVLAAPVADAEACFFGNYGNYGQRQPQVIIIRPGNNGPGPIIGGNPPGTIIGPNPPGIILNRNAVEPGIIPSNDRKTPVTINQGYRNPDRVPYPLYYSDYGYF